ncbi:tyrosine-type recombinase/integrase [Croceicoccus naphthovorans]|uniref:Uncharacterized protein n=1 Tax=Croceicoccus naphthovorans TaxID=1348774 RepID=A0A0G3XKN6_9SPHN|nr:site-specific integrase [Croceicoccus naphthovorans]AKM10993.1 hypothetical protein AB433_15090 [Croceicoccus naphthovorans]MBB3992345.1 integrase [Croceicoccus naphthovorans]
MARSINKLNAITARNLTKPGLHADGRGLYLNVEKSGAKSWRYIFKHARRRRELGLGSYPTVSLAEARSRAEELNQRRSEGECPTSYRVVETDDTEQPTTFGEFATDYVDLQKAGWKNLKHRQQWRNSLETYCGPIWDKSISDVDLEDLQTILRPIWLDKHETASRVRGRIERVLDAARLKGLRTGENPAAWRGNLALLLPKVRKGPKRHQPSMPYQDAPEFISRLRSNDGLASRALELTIHTATRTSEVLHARWDEFDLDVAVWTIPAERMKAGRAHRVPLSEQVIALIEALPRQNAYLFPGAKPDKPLSNMSMLQVLRRMGLGRYTVHGFRSSFRDWAADVAEVPREIAEAALAHQVGSEVERAYRRGDALEQRRDLMRKWSKFVV